MSGAVSATMLRRTYRTEYVLLGTVLLLLAALLLVPWNDFAAYHGAAQNRKYAVAGMRGSAQSPARSITLWNAAVVYSPATGILEVDVSSRYGEPLEGVMIRADLTPAGGGHAAGVTLARQPDGTFRSSRLGLGRGDWLIGLTAARRSDLMFRLEQVLRVE